MTVRSRFDMASTGKTFTASCLALLVCDGLLDPDAPFTRYLPEHQLGHDCDITVRDLSVRTVIRRSFVTEDHTPSYILRNTVPFPLALESPFDQIFFCRNLTACDSLKEQC